MVTVNDVAKVAGVSATTVSRAFNPEGIIKEETRQRIIEIARKLHYTPNFNARSLVTKKNYIIGIFFSSMFIGTSATFLGDIVSRLYEKLPKNYLLSVNSVDRLSIVEQRFDGILIISQSNTDNDLIYRIKAANVPLVVINRSIDDEEVVNVVAKEASSIEKLFERAIESGHRQFGLINGIPGFSSTDERRQSVAAILAKHEIKLSPVLEQAGDYTITSGYQGMRKMLSLPLIERPTFVFCANDDMAIGAMKACNEQLVRIPEDISILGYDDIPYASVVEPGLTTIHNPYKEMSTKGIELLIQQIDQQPIKQRKFYFETRISLRGSVKL